jgi:hypothetical protein
MSFSRWIAHGFRVDRETAGTHWIMTGSRAGEKINDEVKINDEGAMMNDV